MILWSKNIKLIKSTTPAVDCVYGRVKAWATFNNISMVFLLFIFEEVYLND